MAIIAVDSSKAIPQKGIDYILDEEKVECYAVRNLSPGADLSAQMMASQQLFGKGDDYDERKYWHFKIAFPPSDKRELGGRLDPEKALQFGDDVLQKFFPEHEAVLAVQNHGQKENPNEVCRHIHIIVNNIDPVTGLKIHMTHEERRAIKDYVQELSQQYGLYVLDWREAERKAREERRKTEKRSTKAEHLTYAEQSLRDKNGRPIAPEKLSPEIDWKVHTKEILQFAKARSCSFDEFENTLKEYGVTVRRTATTISYRYPGHKNGVRGDRLGEEYTPEQLKKTFEKNRETRAEKEKLTSILEQRRPVEAPQKLSAEQIKADEAGYLKGVIRYAKSRSKSMDEFENHLKEYGVTLSRNTEKTISYRIEETGRAFRGASLGAEFDVTAVRETISGRPAPKAKPSVKAPEKVPEGEAPADVKEYIRGVVDYAKTTSQSMEEFEKTLAEYRISMPRNTEKTISFSFDGDKAVRGSTLGEAYSAEQIRTTINGGDDDDGAAGIEESTAELEEPSVSDAQLIAQLDALEEEHRRLQEPEKAKPQVSWKDQLRAIITYAKETCKTGDEFFATLEEYGVTCPVVGSNCIYYYHPGVDKEIRGDTLGGAYTIDAVTVALGENATRPVEVPAEIPPELREAFRELGRAAGIDEETIERTIADAEKRTLSREEKSRLWDDYKATTSRFWEQRKQAAETIDDDIKKSYASIGRLREELDKGGAFWDHYREQKAAINAELSAAFKELKAAKNASWALNPRNRRSSLFSMFQAFVYQCRHDSVSQVKARIDSLKYSQDRLYRSVETHKQWQAQIKSELDKRYQAVAELKARKGDLKAETSDFKAMSDEVYSFLKSSTTTADLDRYYESIQELQGTIEHVRDSIDPQNMNFTDLVAAANRRQTLADKMADARRRSEEQAAIKALNPDKKKPPTHGQTR